MTEINPEKDAELTSEQKAVCWINDARINLLDDDDEFVDERVNLAERLEIAERIVPILPDFRDELARLYDRNHISKLATMGISMLGIHTVMVAQRVDHIRALIEEHREQ